MDRDLTSHTGMIRAGNDALDRWVACPGHHCHWVGVVYEDTRYVSYERTSERFQRFLRRLKAQHPKEY